MLLPLAAGATRAPVTMGSAGTLQLAAAKVSRRPYYERAYQQPQSTRLVHRRSCSFITLLRTTDHQACDRDPGSGPGKAWNTVEMTRSHSEAHCTFTEVHGIR